MREESFDQTRPEVVQCSSSVRKQSEENDDVEKALKAFSDDLKPPPPQLCSQVAQLLEKRRIEALMSGNYDEAERQDKLSMTLQSMLETEQKSQNLDDELDQRYRDLNEEQRRISEKWETKIKTFMVETDKQEKQLKEQQQKEREDFAKKWKDPLFLRQYARPSPQLLQLRDREKAMAVSRMYREAKEMRVFADRLQVEETKAAELRMNNMMMREKQRMKDLHERQLKALEGYKERNISSMQSEKKKELVPIVSAKDRMKVKKRSNITIPQKKAFGVISSPRTQTMFSRFKVGRESLFLEVGPLNGGKGRNANRAKSVILARRIGTSQPLLRSSNI